MDINLNLYKYFYITAKNLSYTKAAKELFISQPSLSYSVKILEKQLGKILFKRTTTGIELTSDGNILYNKLIPIANLLEKIEEENNEIKKITIGIRPMYNYCFFPTRVKLLKKIFPNLEIDYKTGYSEDLLSYFKDNKVDLIIDDKVYDNISKITLKSIPVKLCFICDINNNININSINDLNKQKILLVDSNIFSQKLKEMYPNLKYENMISTPIMVNNIIGSNNLGYSFDLLVSEYIKTNQIKIIESKLPLPNQNDLYLYYNKNNNKIDPIINIFANYNLLESLNEVNK